MLSLMLSLMRSVMQAYYEKFIKKGNTFFIKNLTSQKMWKIVMNPPSAINFLQGGAECSPRERWNFENHSYHGTKAVNNITINVKNIRGIDIISVYMYHHCNGVSINIYVNELSSKYSSHVYAIVGEVGYNHIYDNGVPQYKIPTIAELLKALKYIDPYIEPNTIDYLQSPINVKLPPINLNCDERDILNKREEALKAREEALNIREEALKLKEQEIDKLYKVLKKKELKQNEGGSFTPIKIKIY